MFGYHEISLARLIRSNLQLDCSCCFRRSLMTRVKYPCPCCGYLVFDESPGSHEICPICFWEDDLTQLRFPLMSGGANPVSLIEAQENYFREGVSELRFRSNVRAAEASDVRESQWRRIDVRADKIEEPIKATMESDPKLSIELIWEDVELEELCITASNGEYCGTARVYFARGDVAALAQTIEGFPKALSQVEVFEGGFDDGPRAKLVFRCIDQKGHAVVRVSLSESAYDNVQPPNMNDVTLEMRFDAAALDQFCKELEAVGKRARKLAILRGLRKGAVWPTS